MPILDPPPALTPLPSQPDGTAWPTTQWPLGSLPAKVDSISLDGLLDRAFGSDPEPEFGESYATLIVHRGQIVAERYGPQTSVDTPLLSWSMAKSVTHALIGILIDQGRLDPHAPASVPEWSNDSRREITLHQLLRMVDGLEFNEAYAMPDDGSEAAWSHCIDMLFGEGTARPATYAARRPAAHPPDTVFNYSSGTTNLVARILGDHIGRGPQARAWMHEHLFAPIGMTTAEPTFDEDGNFIGSSYLHATARDWARFGLLHLRGGEWDGRQIVSSDWVDDGRATRAVDANGSRYGAHWWTYPDGRGRFYASGFEWQRVACVPTTDLVVVRLGKTSEADYPHLVTWFDDLIAHFDPVNSRS